MIAADTLHVLRIVAAALDELRDEALFVGGAILGFLVTSSAPPRETDDVDLVIDIATYAEHVQLTERLRALGFAEDASEGAPTCRWTFQGIKVDVMSSGPMPGPTNRWYAEAMAHAQVVALSEHLSIRIMTAPYFAADKLDTFGDGRRGDYVSSHDLEDVVAVIDGRDTIVADIFSAPDSVQEFLRHRFKKLLSQREFVDAVAGHLRGDAASQARLPLVLARMRAIASAA